MGRIRRDNLDISQTGRWPNSHRRATAVPGVGREMMVITARPEETAAWHAGRCIESEHVAEEGLGGGDGSDLQMDMPDDATFR